MPDCLYLASQSPRRSQLLDQLGVRHELLLPNAPDDAAEDSEAIEVQLPGEAPRAYVARVTSLKLDAAVARLARRSLPEAPVLCSDTTVALGRRIYGKPSDPDDAARMLAELSGHTHRVLTAMALQVGSKRLTALSVSSVQFAELSPGYIAAYVATGEPLGKAGAYAVQGRAGAFIPLIRGSYSGIMGLPLFETSQLLRAAGFAV